MGHIPSLIHQNIPSRHIGWQRGTVVVVEGGCGGVTLWAEE